MHTNSYILAFNETNKTKISLAGGKGANLGELSGIKGLNVPDGFCVSTKAFERIISDTPFLKKSIDELSLLTIHDQVKIQKLSAEIRRAIIEAAVPQDIADEITNRLSVFGDTGMYAVRSSATAEDLPENSFAGQQDSFLNITGTDAILAHVSMCWASLFTKRAVIYRLQGGFDNSKVSLLFHRQYPAVLQLR